MALAGAVPGHASPPSTTNPGQILNINGCLIIVNAVISGDHVNCPNWDLHGAQLSKVNLVYANLQGANLSGSDLRQASLNGANLSRANLSGANLGGANLQAANLSKANLTGANLKDIYSYEANWSGANLTGATWIDGHKCQRGSIGVCRLKPPPSTTIQPMP
jgi:uncharacterized protein YjbI with pentapeptide repeats